MLPVLHNLHYVFVHILICMVNIVLLLSLDMCLTKVEKEYNVDERWSPSDPQFISSVVAQEALRAKQTKKMLLVSSRRWFLLSWKKKYSGTSSSQSGYNICSSLQVILQ